MILNTGTINPQIDRVFDRIISSKMENRIGIGMEVNPDSPWKSKSVQGAFNQE
jgi:hypothetical protein